MEGVSVCVNLHFFALYNRNPKCTLNGQNIKFFEIFSIFSYKQMKGWKFKGQFRVVDEGIEAQRTS